MNINLTEKLKSLRAQRGISQEKLAQYLGVSFQAVSRWETGSACPDIALLPDIARFFGVTIDELLCVEKLDERRLFAEYSARAGELSRCGRREEALALWQEAYKRMPNNIDVKEMLMSGYFDADRQRYFGDFVELATEIYAGNAEGEAPPMYYKGQAIAQLARAYAERGNDELAQKWASRSVSLFNSSELISAFIDMGEALVGDVAFCTHWFLEELFYLAARIAKDDGVRPGDKYKQACFKTVASVYEAVYTNDDMGFEQLQHLYTLHQGIAEYETRLGKDEAIIHAHLERALDCCQKSRTVKAHKLTLPLLYDWPVSAAPGDGFINLRLMKDALAKEAYKDYRERAWFAALEEKLAALPAGI